MTRDDVIREAMEQVGEVAIDDVRSMLACENRPVLLDVRGRDEFEQGWIDGAVHVPRGLLELRIEEIVPEPSTPIVVYCAAGIRSVLAAKTLQDMGYVHVSSMRGGFNGWKDAGLPVAPKSVSA